jgi:hypothetical protein
MIMAKATSKPDNGTSLFLSQCNIFHVLVGFWVFVIFMR